MTTRLEFKADLTVTSEGLIEGIAWPFGSADRVGDIIEKGAIATPTTLPMLFAHDQSQVIGVWDTIAETDAGLTVKGRLLIDDVARANEVRAMISAKAVSGLSIGFVTTKSTPRARGRTINALTLHEISVVAVPCHPGAQITSLKSDDTTPMIKDTHMDPELINDQPPAIPANAPQIDTKAFDEIKARLDKMEAKANRPQGVHIAGPVASDETKAFGNFLRRGVERISPDEAKALTVGTDANGGFLAPQEFGGELIKLLNEFSPLRQYAKVIQISAASIIYPRRLTGTSASWTAETANRVASGMTFEQVTMTPYELATFTDASNALLEDNAYNLEGELLSDFAESFAKTEGLAFVKGTGTGQPVGIMTSTDIAEIKTGVAANFPAANPADVLIAMYHKIASVFAQTGVWMMNRNTLAVVRTWKDGNGRYLVLDPITAGAPSTLLGRPVVEMTDMDDIGAGKCPILFGDMSGYRIIDRVGLTTLRDPYSLAANGQVRFHARKRVGADVTHPDRFIKLKCAV
ncbi:HK97 family phage major capsid protein/HK97 family phage prohead protease [Loktanella ponticola]|uniref:HK97 family phage major capsid protein/HK97 family phage prohead protease n=1 Tax=Yoonia ponticola TaxID=1524255 RepID=A0A7W9BNB7_9RHOB|nr:phage major capsid protein [Yoonia ponticola]MBB5723209.1 HK97 family phage major capsid protein/HK97 family phage prohead protease [Yoonia ponticola]